MKISWFRLSAFVVFGLILAVSSGCQTVSAPDQSVQRAEFVNLLNAVVRIDVRERTFENGREQIISGVGSGVILSEEGYILTNAHVVSSKAIDISVTLSSLERVNARFVGWDHWTDLALIQLDLKEIEERGLTFTAAKFGDSEKLYPGQTVFAVGTPNG
ncbi:MAG TPA: trypsin-like peptidase domain-containing protein, partial [Opitutales bacterium]|nr:trypsin-like peptidase domain-containing protein [Opitutales bacterium]